MQKLADDNPAVTEFRFDLAIEPLQPRHRRCTGKPSEAETELRKAIALLQKLADDNPAVIQLPNGTGQQPQQPRFRICRRWASQRRRRPSAARRSRSWGRSSTTTPRSCFTGNSSPQCSTSLGGLLLKLGRPAEALDAYGRAFTLFEQLIKENPADKDYPPNRVRSLVGRGRARRALGDPAGAAADVRHALRLSEGLRLPEGYAAFAIACSHAALAGLAGQEGTGVSAAEGKAHADQAMALLRKAVDGFRDIHDYRTEGALDPLREREDFKKLLTELEQKSAAKPK